MDLQEKNNLIKFTGLYIQNKNAEKNIMNIFSFRISLKNIKPLKMNLTFDVSSIFLLLLKKGKLKTIYAGKISSVPDLKHLIFQKQHI